MTRLVLEMQCAVCQLSGRNASRLKGGEGRLEKLVQLLSVHICVCSERAEPCALLGLCSVCATTGQVFCFGHLSDWRGRTLASSCH